MEFELNYSSVSADAYEAYNIVQTIDADVPLSDPDNKGKMLTYPRNDAPVSDRAPFYYDPQKPSFQGDQSKVGFTMENNRQLYFFDGPARYESTFNLTFETTIMGRSGNDWTPVTTIKWSAGYRDGFMLKPNVIIGSSPSFTHYMLSIWPAYNH